jgi:hypothetical protein
MNIKELVKGKTAKFVFYRGNELFYEIGDFQFPVPIDDLGSTHINAEEKAIFLMRYVRKHLANIEAGRANQ